MHSKREQSVVVMLQLVVIRYPLLLLTRSFLWYMIEAPVFIGLCPLFHGLVSSLLVLAMGYRLSFHPELVLTLAREYWADGQVMQFP